MTDAAPGETQTEIDQKGAARRKARRSAAFGLSNAEQLRTGALVVIALVLGVAALQEARAFAVPTVLAILLAVALSPLARRLERMGISATLVAAVLTLTLFAGAIGGLYALAPSAEAWRDRAPEVMRSVEKLGRTIQKQSQQVTGQPPDSGVSTDGTGSINVGAPRPEGGAEAPDAVGEIMDSGKQLATDLLLSAPAMLGALLYAAFLTFFLLAERDMLGRLALRGAPSMRRRLGVARALRNVQEHISGYLLAITVINAGLGLCAGLAFWALGLPSPALFGFLVFVMNYMPFIGPMIMNVIVFGVGLVTFGDPVQAALPVAALVMLNLAEGQAITPMVVGRSLELSPLMIFIAITFGAWLWGAAGAVIATPTVIVASVFIRRAERQAQAEKNRSARRR